MDGALKKTMHASVSLDEEANLVFCINPIVPFDTRMAPYGQPNSRDQLMRGGLPVVLSQTFRSIIYSRMRIGM